MSIRIEWLEDKKFYDFIIRDDRTRIELQVTLPTEKRQADEKDDVNLVLTKEVEIKFHRFSLSTTPEEARILANMLHEAAAEVKCWEAGQRQ
jgi:hypothetical protein